MMQVRSRLRFSTKSMRQVYQYLNFLLQRRGQPGQSVERSVMLSDMSGIYRSNLDDGLEKALAWLDRENIQSLPDSVWDCPKDCPIWSLGLSLAQAGGIYARLKQEVQRRGGTIEPKKEWLCGLIEEAA